MPAPTPATSMTAEQLHTLITWLVGGFVGVVGFLGSAMLLYGRYVLRIGELRKLLADYRENQSKRNAYIADLFLQLANGSQLDPIAVSRDILKLASDEIQTSIERERKTENPLSLDELMLLEMYRQKIQKSESFSLDEAREFQRLTQKWTAELDRRKSENVGAFILGGIAGLILGAMITKDR